VEIPRSNYSFIEVVGLFNLVPKVSECFYVPFHDLVIEIEGFLQIWVTLDQEINFHKAVFSQNRGQIVNIAHVCTCIIRASFLE
jgi:hypothetical protein